MNFCFIDVAHPLVLLHWLCCLVEWRRSLLDLLLEFWTIFLQHKAWSANPHPYTLGGRWWRWAGFSHWEIWRLGAKLCSLKAPGWVTGWYTCSWCVRRDEDTSGGQKQWHPCQASFSGKPFLIWNFFLWTCHWGIAVFEGLLLLLFQVPSNRCHYHLIVLVLCVHCGVYTVYAKCAKCVCKVCSVCVQCVQCV